MKKRAWLGQWLGAILTACGIGIELATGAEIGYILITVGALTWGIATKLSRR